MKAKQTKYIMHLWIVASLLLVPMESANADFYERETIINMLEEAHQRTAVGHADRLNEQFERAQQIQADDQMASPDALLNEARQRMQQVGIFSLAGPEPTDKAYLLTRQLLGQPATQALSFVTGHPIASNDPDDMQVTGVTMLLSIVSWIGLTLVFILAGYTFLGGVLNTGRDGEFLGRKWDSLYVPLRTSLSMLGTWPVPAFGGLSVVQMLVLMVFFVGIGIGSRTFAAMAPVMFSTPLVNVNFDQDRIQEIAETIAEMQICGMTQAYMTDAVLPDTRYNLNVAQNPVTTSTSIMLTYNLPGSYVCGAVRANIRPMDLDRTDGIDWRTRVQMASGGILGAVRDVTGTDNSLTNSELMKNQLENELKLFVMTEAIPRLFEDIEALTMFSFHLETFAREHQEILQYTGDTSEVMTIGGEVLNKAVTQIYWRALDRFEASINRQTKEIIESSAYQSSVRDEFEEAVQTHGMMLGGSFYYLISRQQNLMSQAIENSLPTTHPISIQNLQEANWFVSSWQRFSDWLAGMSGRSERITDAKSIYDAIMDFGVDRHPDAAASLRSIHLQTSDDMMPQLGDVNRWIAESMTGVARWGQDTSALNPDPLLEMQSLGVKIQQGVLVMLGLKTAATIKTGALSTAARKAPGTSAGMNMLKKLMGPAAFVAGLLMSLLLLISFIYANVIPLLPFIIYTLSALGLITVLFKSLVAAPLWWALKAHPEGDDLISHSRHGYPMLMTLAIRPMLMVVGLFAAMALTRISSAFLNEIIMPTVQISNDGLLSPTGLLNYFLLYGIMMLLLVYKNFALIYELPQVVLGWMGVDKAYTDFGEQQGQAMAAGMGAYASSTIEKGIAGGRR